MNIALGHLAYSSDSVTAEGHQYCEMIGSGTEKMNRHASWYKTGKLLGKSAQETVQLPITHTDPHTGITHRWDKHFPTRVVLIILSLLDTNI